MNIITPRIVWRFSRPHTIIGTSISIMSIYLLVLFASPSIPNQPIGFIPGLIYSLKFHVSQFLPTLIACLACNLYITGLNQISDIPIDKINKPNLPIITGELSIKQAKIIVFLSLLTALFFSYFHDIKLFFLILIIGFIGSIYSLPPIRLKYRYSWASMAIALVRGPLINIGIALHFILLMNPQINWSNYPWLLPLTIFITAFSIGIAWFKDIPDTEGDTQFNVKTLAATVSKEKALRMGTQLIVLTYLLMAGIWFFIPSVNKNIAIQMLILHVFLVVLFYAKSKKTNLDSQESIKKFYKFYWVLFFLEYLLLPVFMYCDLFSLFL